MEQNRNEKQSKKNISFSQRITKGNSWRIKIENKEKYLESPKEALINILSYSFLVLKRVVELLIRKTTIIDLDHLVLLNAAGSRDLQQYVVNRPNFFYFKS